MRIDNRNREKRLVFVCAGAILAIACAEEFGEDEALCAQFVRFASGLNHPVEIRDGEHTPNKPRVRILYRGTRNESSTDGIALCRFSDQTGELEVAGAWIDDSRIEQGVLSAFKEFRQAKKRESGG